MMADVFSWTGSRVGSTRTGHRRCGFFLALLSVGWLAATTSAADTQTVTYDAQGNPVTLASGTTAVAPVIVSNPVAQVAQKGTYVTFSVDARGTPPLTYQWKFNNVDLTTTQYASANKATLVLGAIASGVFGNYSVTVTNSAGSATSTGAALKLDSVGDGIPDSWKAQYFGANWATNPDAAADADPDGDGFTNLEEYEDGTDPTSATSHDYRLTVYGDVLAKPAAPRYAPGTVVTLTAQPQGAQQFGSWSVTNVDASTTATSTTNPLTLTLNADYSATAVFETQPPAASGTIPSFTVNNHNARAEIFLVQADGKQLVGGTFDAVEGVAHGSLARFNTDGTLDSTFNPVFNSTVVALAQQADGKLLVGGYFNNVNGVSTYCLVRLNLDGTLDTTFSATSITNFVRSIRLLSGSTQIIVTGDFGNSGTTNANGVARLNSDGSLDNTFATGTGSNTGVIWTAVWQSNGKVVLGGDFTAFNGTTANHLVRLNSNGSIDASFIASADNEVIQIALRSDGDYIVGGSFGHIDGVARAGIARLRAADGGFNAGVNAGAGLNNGGIGGTGLFIQPTTNKPVIVGNFSGVNGSTQAYVARLNTDGSTDTTFTLKTGGSVDNQIYGDGLDASGNVLIGGPFNFVNGAPHLGLARLSGTNGNLDTTYNVQLSYASLIYALAAAPNGKIVAGGSFNVVNGTYRPYVARLNAGGGLDTAFNAGAGPNNFVDAILITPDGKTTIGGDFNTMNGVAAGDIARFNSDGTLDTTFQSTGADNQVNTLAVQADGKIVAGGYFENFDGEQRLRLARLNADGSIDGAFSPAFDNYVESVAVQPDGKIVVGGGFSNFNGSASGDLVRLNADGTLDTGFFLQMPNEATNSVVLQPDGKILIGGSFYILQGANMLANRLARLNTDGTVDPSFHIGGSYGYDNYVDQVGLQPDGKIISVGDYSNASGLSASLGLPRLKADGSADTLLGAGSINNVVYAITTLADDSVVLGGPFSVADGLSRFGFVRYVTQSSIKPGTVTASPAGPTFSATAKVTFSVTPTTVANDAIGGVSFEVSADGVHYTTLGAAGAASSSGAYALTTALPPGVSYVRAAVTDAQANLAHSFAAGPFTTPPVVTSVLTAAGSVGIPFSYTGTATQPLTGFTATGLPAWATATFNANTGTLAITGTPTNTGTPVITLKPANAAGTGSAVLNVTIASNTSAWTTSHFSAAERANPAVSGPAGDATGAGIANLLKHALGIPPHETGLSARLPQAGAQKFGDESYLTLTYTRDLSATDVLLTVQVSGHVDRNWNSGPGHTVEISRTDNGDGTETVVTRDTVPVSAGRPRFIRLQATQINQ